MPKPLNPGRVKFTINGKPPPHLDLSRQGMVEILDRLPLGEMLTMVVLARKLKISQTYGYCIGRSLPNGYRMKTAGTGKRGYVYGNQETIAAFQKHCTANRVQT